MCFEDTHIHNTEVTVAGTTFARTIEIIAPYSITFEDGQYTVILKGSNNNIFDVVNGILNQNQVQVVPTNSAGLIVTQTGGEFTSAQKTSILAVLGIETDGTIVLPAQGALYEAIQMLIKNLALAFKDTMRHTRVYGGAGPTGDDVTSEILSAYDGDPDVANEIFRFTVDYTYENNKPKEMKCTEVAVP
jgi:hypothetical protein